MVQGEGGVGAAGALGVQVGARIPEAVGRHTCLGEGPFGAEGGPILEVEGCHTPWEEGLHTFGAGVHILGVVLRSSPRAKKYIYIKLNM